MENGFYTLQEYLTHTKGVTYIIMGVSLLAFVGFWLFLTGRDDDAPPEEASEATRHRHQGGNHDHV